MAHSDFAWVNFDEEFNSSNQSATRTFEIEGIPIGTAYLLIQHLDVEVGFHRILINSQDLPGFDIPAQNKIERFWATWMERVPPGLLHQGENSITIRRVTLVSSMPGSSVPDPPAISAGPVDIPEFFGVANVAIHWREQD